MPATANSSGLWSKSARLNDTDDGLAQPGQQVVDGSLGIYILAVVIQDGIAATGSTCEIDRSETRFLACRRERSCHG